MNILLFGCCESTWNSAFAKALQEDNIKVSSFAYPASHPFNHIYNFYRKENQNIIKESDLIILNIANRGFMSNEMQQKHLLAVYHCFYKILSKLQKKVLVIQWHHYIFCGGKYTSFHKIQCKKYGFNFIDTYKFCLKENLMDFYTKIIDFTHPIPYIYTKMAQKIKENLKLFQTPKQIPNLKIPNFKILDLSDFMDTKNKNDFCNIRSYLHRENVLRIENETKKINFPKKYLGMKIVGVHTWNECFTAKGFHSCCIFENKKQKNAVFAFPYQNFRLLDYDFIIDEEIIVHFHFDENTKRPRYDNYDKKFENNKQVGIIGFLLLPQNEILEEVNFIDEDINLGKEYDFSHLCYYLKDFKIITEQYNQRQGLIKFAPLQKQISDLNNERTLLHLASTNSAKARIHNHLAYKLGAALITNSKSIKGVLKMPFILMAITIAHKEQNTNLKLANKILPPLESYSDYSEALKEKECFTYKLGEALIKAHKNWCKGGYLKFYFKDVSKLKREFKKKKNI